MVDEAKLLKLEKDAAGEMFSAGELAWTYAHLISVSNMNRLVERVPAAVEAA